ncbi:MAG: HEAT repeat domain-containing protein [Candidatus Omnitrophica bacterium]|nr:HEAT repeat domain-containing protein [Candidatus Omnitrophota bacterium]
MRKYFLIFFSILSVLFSQELQIEIENLKSNNALKKALSAYRLRNFKCEIRESIPYLLDILDDETVIVDKNLGKTTPSEESKKTLLKIGPDILPYIFEKLNDPEVSKKKKLKMIELVDEMNDKNGIKTLENLINTEDSEIREKVLMILAKYEDEIDFLINFVKNQDDNTKIKIIIYFGQNKIKKSLPYLYECLKDKNWEIRKYAIWSIGEIKENVDVEKLIPLVNDKNNFVRKEIAETFGKIKNPRTISCLIELLNDSNWYVKIASIKSACEFNNVRFFEPILNLIYDKQIEVKLEAIKALAVFKDKRATLPLISNLNDRYHLLIREYSAYALGEIRDKRAIYSLINLLKSENYELKKIARESLKKITGIDLGYDIEKWYNWAGQNKISSIKEN